MLSQNIGRHLRDALKHLDDIPYLEAHPLAMLLHTGPMTPENSRGRALRRTLRWAIAALDPGTSASETSLQTRSYWVLYHYAISCQSMDSIAAELGLSRRQAYRELTIGLEGLAELLSQAMEQRTKSPHADVESEGSEYCAPKLHEELERLSWLGSTELSLHQLVRDAIQTVQPLADATCTELVCRESSQDIRIDVNRQLLRQSIVNILSYILDVHVGALLEIDLHESPTDAMLSILYHPRCDMPPLDPKGPYSVAIHSLDMIGASLEHELSRSGFARLKIRIPGVRRTKVLVIDDNYGFVALFRRYLANEPYVVQGASDLPTALALQKEFKPDVIVVDIIMPDLDGWQVLQTLHSVSSERNVSYIMCSVINDPHLARALGADGFLSKPVDRLSLLQALDSVRGAET